MSGIGIQLRKKYSNVQNVILLYVNLIYKNEKKLNLQKIYYKEKLNKQNLEFQAKMNAQNQENFEIQENLKKKIMELDFSQNIK